MEWKRNVEVAADNNTYVMDKVEGPALGKSLELLFLTKGKRKQVEFMIETQFMLPRLVTAGIVAVAYERYIDESSVTLTSIKVDSFYPL